MPVCPESAGLILRVMYQSGVPLAQRIARWTSNPKVLGSIPRWDETFFYLSPILFLKSLWKNCSTQSTVSLV